jgi:hypothetical protein
MTWTHAIAVAAVVFGIIPALWLILLADWAIRTGDDLS